MQEDNNSYFDLRFKTSPELEAEKWLKRSEETLTKAFQDALKENEKSGSVSSALELLRIAEARDAVTNKLKVIEDHAMKRMLDWHFPPV